MIVILRPDATETNIQHIVERAGKLKRTLGANISRGVERTVIGFIGPEDALRVIPLEVFPGVDQVLQVLAPYRLVSREFKKENTVIKLPYNTTVGGTKNCGDGRPLLGGKLRRHAFNCQKGQSIGC